MNRIAVFSFPHKPWTKSRPPRRVLAIRMQAMGDTVITLPYLQHLRNNLPPETELDFLTREEVNPIPKSLHLFNRVYSIRGGRNGKKQFFYALWLLPRLWMRRYDAVIDLQNHTISRTVRKALRPKAWSAFDRFSPVPAGECNRQAIEALGLGACKADANFRYKILKEETTRLLKQSGWDGGSQLVVLNPAGAFPTRNWPLENYAQFARLWLHVFPHTQFVVMGTAFITERAGYLKNALGNRLLQLVQKTNPAQAFALLRHVRLVLSEDSGLMHMSWVSGVPTLALFGSTANARARPLGTHSLLLHSADLPCGNCMLEQCRWGDTRCLTRYSAEFVFEKALSLLNAAQHNQGSQNSAPLPLNETVNG